jgi:phosphoribosylanthranilate isomerase
MALLLKICGMKVPSNILEVAALRPAYMGFIFYKGSKRYIADLPAGVIDALPSSIKKTGVFVDASLEEVVAAIAVYSLDAVQLHGNESEAYCKALKDAENKVEIIKAFGVDEEFDFGRLGSYADVVDYFLFDTKTEGHGGSGLSFSWELLQKYTLAKPYFLSGGIGLEALSEVQNITDPRLYAVDVNSRFELEPGVKDITKLKEIIL